MNGQSRRLTAKSAQKIQIVRDRPKHHLGDHLLVSVEQGFEAAREPCIEPRANAGFRNTAV